MQPVGKRIWQATDTDQFTINEGVVRETHERIQDAVDEIGVDTLVAQLSSNLDGPSYGMTVYADEEIDCLTVPPGFIDRLCRRAGVEPYSQRAVFNAYYQIIEDTEFEVPPFCDILIVDKTIVSGYDE